jgi:hypothetical protein
MKYELNLKMENGKIHSKISGDMELFGIRFKIKDYEVSGDINETLEILASIFESTSPEKGAQIVVDMLVKSLGLKEETVTRIKTALMSKM